MATCVGPLAWGSCCPLCPGSGCVMEDLDRDPEGEMSIVLNPALPCLPLVGPCSPPRDSWPVPSMSLIWDLTTKEDLVLPDGDRMERYGVFSTW